MKGGILITGGSGSLGQALTARLLQDPPARLVIYSRGEHLQEQMQQKFDHPCMRYYIGDVRDQARLELAMHGIDTVIHCAALKIIPKCEADPIECVATNIGGAENVIRAALRTNSVQRVLGISTDKACAPINLYGATKLAQEKIFVAANNLVGNRDTRFSVVRYGNVLHSRGSVVPFFKRLKTEGERLPVTDPRMTRFHITLDEAVDLIFFALENMMGREIFVPRLPSFRIMDLVKAMDCDSYPIGIRPGEKLHETLITRDEARFTSRTWKHYVINGSGDAMPMPNPDFSYTSDANDRWLTVEELRAL